MLTHVLNLAMSILGAVDVINAAATVGKTIVDEGGSGSNAGEGGRVPNPCSYYLLNLGIDVSALSLDSVLGLSASSSGFSSVLQH